MNVVIACEENKKSVSHEKIFTRDQCCWKDSKVDYYKKNSCLDIKCCVDLLRNWVKNHKAKKRSSTSAVCKTAQQAAWARNEKLPGKFFWVEKWYAVWHRHTFWWDLVDITSNWYSNGILVLNISQTSFAIKNS